MRWIQKSRQLFFFEGVCWHIQKIISKTLWDVWSCFSYLDNVCGLKSTFAKCVFLDGLARWLEIKTGSLNSHLHHPSPPAEELQYISSVQIFTLTPCVALLSLDLNPVQKKAQVEKRIVQELGVYIALYILDNLAMWSINTNLKFYEITNQLFSKYYRLQVKNGENTK